MSRFYKSQEFAELAGITIKALRHYDRLGLLKPARSGAGYRLYTDRHLERLEQILALKFLGLPLKSIAAALDRAALELPDALRVQRRALEEKQVLLARAIGAIQAAEKAIQPGQPADTAILKKLIEVIQMQDAVEAMKQYYTAEEWEKRKRYYEEGPSPEWQSLYRDTNVLLAADPASDAVQSLADRWLALTLRAANGDPGAQQDSMKAWRDREHWPPAMKRRIAEFNLEQVTELIRQAALSSRKKYFSGEAWSKLVEIRKQSGQMFGCTWQDRVDLFVDAERAFDENLQGDAAQSLATRWAALLDLDSGGDPAVKAGLTKWWADRLNWPANLRWWVEGLYRMTGERFDRTADFLDRAVASRPAP